MNEVHPEIVPALVAATQSKKILNDNKSVSG